MILQSLTQCYEKLAQDGKLEKQGWSKVNVSWALTLDEEGALVNQARLDNVVTVGKKEKWVPQSLRLPVPEKRTVGIVPNYLWDNSTYVLGMDNKGRQARTDQCFAAFREKHEDKLKNVDHPAAAALLRFLAAWDPHQAKEHPVLSPIWEELCAGGNIVFRFNGVYLHEVPEVAATHDPAAGAGEGPEGVCLVTGRQAPIARLHPGITGFPGAQSSGASLVSFQDNAFCSYGYDDQDRGLNAPVSEYAAFAYGEALKWLLHEPDHHRMLGETMMLFWAEDGDDYTAQLYGGALDGVTDEDMKSAIAALADGKPYRWHNIPLSPSNRFYVLGLAPNAARLSVRFFLMDTFGGMVKNLQEHMDHMALVRPAYEQREGLALWQVLRETVNPNSREKKPSPTLSGDLPRTVLQGLPYPATLYQQVQLRIRAGEEVTWGKASIIKAYLLKNVVGSNEHHVFKEGLTKMLHEDTNCTPYVLGRLFAVLEEVQEKANPGIKATIRDRFFNSACTMPYTVFPTLLRLAQAHLKKIDGWYYDRLIQNLLGKLDITYPKRLTLEEQGMFQIGYYHQKQYRYMKKEANDHA